MDVKKLVVFIVVIILFCAGAISILWYLLSGNTQLRDGIIAEIVGGGILGTIVAAVFLYLQEAGEYQTNKKKAQSFYDDKLILDLKEAYDRNTSPWNFSGLQKFYFDNSRINSLFDIYQDNFSEINNYDAYFPDNELIKLFGEFYREARKGYVLGEKLEGEIYQLVRSEHHRLQLIAANDFSSQAYIKGQLFAELSDDVIIRYLEWQTIPERIPQILDKAKNKAEITNLIEEIRLVRENLLKKERKIESFSRK